jgi:hypothetical protein
MTGDRSDRTALLYARLVLLRANGGQHTQLRHTLR